MREEPTLIKPINRYAVISLVMAVLALLCFCIGAAPIPLTALACYPASVVLSILAFWAGLKASRQIRARSEGGQSLAQIGIWVGVFTLLFIACALAMVIALWPHIFELFQPNWHGPQNDPITCQSPCLGVSLLREWLGPGGLPGLQTRWRVALRAAVGSTPIHSRYHSNEGRVALNEVKGVSRAVLVSICQKCAGYSTSIFHRYNHDSPRN